jgi:hypothetical protein
MRRQGSIKGKTDQAAAAAAAEAEAVEKVIVRIVHTGHMAVAVALHDSNKFALDRI